jgi:hypothetical protein
MNKVIRLNPLTDPAWDQFVHQHRHGSHVHLSSWQRVVEGSFPHVRGYGLAVVDESNTIQAGLPVYHVKSWLTGDRLVSVPFANFSDPLTSQEEDIPLLMDAVQELSRELHTERIELRLRHLKMPQHIEPWIATVNYQTHTIVLDKPVDKLYKEFHKSCVQRKIKRSLESGLTIRTAKDEADWQAFYEIYLSHRQHRGLPPQPFRFFQKLAEHFQDIGILQLLLAEKDGVILGGMYVFTFRQTMMADTLATRDDLKEMNLPIFLYWQGIQVAYNQGCKEFNLGRTSITNTSLADHKRKWASKVEDLVELQRQFRGPHAAHRREESVLYKSARLLLSSVPSPAFELLGRVAYKHIG